MRNTYFWHCPDCGGNFDPDEKCDCDPPKHVPSRVVHIYADDKIVQTYIVPDIEHITRRNEE